MPVINSKDPSEKASEKPGLSRRGFISAASSAALALPAATGLGLASAGAVETELPALSDDDQFAALVEQLRDVLHRMHPIVNRSAWHLSRQTDGTFYLTVGGSRTFEEFTGPGLYDISVSGYVMTHWIEKRPAFNLRTGKRIPDFDQFKGCIWQDKGYVDYWRDLGSSVNIVCKHEGGEAPNV